MSGSELNEDISSLGMSGPLGPALFDARVVPDHRTPVARQVTLELFMAQLAEIVPDSAKTISPDSDLIADLGFDSLAFGRLGLLLYEHYGVGGVSTASMRSTKHLTVEGFFRHCVLDVLGTDGQGAPDEP